MSAARAADTFLLAKEACVGIGADLTVLTVRFFPGIGGAYALGALCIFAGLALRRPMTATSYLPLFATSKELILAEIEEETRDEVPA